MKVFDRFAIYALPEGGFYRKGAEWLGWDSVAGRACAHPDLPALPQTPERITATPRKYGLHGTLKPPFRLADGYGPRDMEAACAALAARMAPVTLPALVIRRLGGFIAAVPTEETPDLRHLADECVRDLDVLRAPADAAELSRRRKAGLSARQEELLAQWGYPYVMEEFRFHITLTGHLPHGEVEAVTEALKAHFAPVLPKPFVIGDIALLGEYEGRFHLIHRYALGGNSAASAALTV